MFIRTQVIRPLAVYGLVAMAAVPANGQGLDWRSRIVGTWNNISTGKNIIIRGVSGQQDHARIEGSALGNGESLDACSYDLTVLNDNQISLELNSGPDTCLKGVFIREQANDQRRVTVGTWNHLASGENINIRRVVGGLDSASIEGSGSGAVVSGCSYHLTIINSNQLNLELKNGPETCLKGVLLRVVTPAVGISTKLSLDPKDPKAHNSLCDEYNKKGDYGRAIVDCSEAIGLEPKYVEAYDNRGIAYLNKGDYDHAIADYTEAIRLDQKYTVGYFNRGLAFYDKGDFDHAIADYTQAIQLDPKYVFAYNNRGNANSAKGHYDQAIADYTEAIKLDPSKGGSPVIGGGYYDRGLAYYNKGDYDHAIADYTQAIQLDPKYVFAYNNRGNAYKAKGDFDHAITDYTEAVKLDPKYAVAYDSRGFTYNAKGDYDHAMADYTEAIRLNPKYEWAYFGRGIANLYAGALPKALADLDQSSELDPKFAYAALWLDVVDKRSNLTSRLAEATKQIDMTKWPAPVIRFYLGQLTADAVLAAADDPDAKTKESQTCEANFFIGELVLQQSNKDEATRLFRHSVTDCPKSSFQWAAANAELRALGVPR
jgi:tetratricopeptide (TPR) repeat protein